jgi:hypothetical protein
MNSRAFSDPPAEGLPLCPAERGPFQAPFVRQSDDYDRFENWYRALFSARELTQEQIDRICETYYFVVSSNPGTFDFDVVRPNPPSSLHRRLRAHLITYFRDLARSCGLPTRLTKLQSAINCFARMLLFVDFNSVTYQREFISLLVPIFHVVFYGIWSPECEDLGRAEAVEALSAIALVRFLSAPPFRYLKLLSCAEQANGMTTLFLKKLAPFQLFQTKRGLANLPFLGRWFGNLFGADLRVEESILIWDWLLREMRKRSFSDALVAVCAAIPVEMRAECERGDADELMELVQDLKRLRVPAVLRRASVI